CPQVDAALGAMVEALAQHGDPRAHVAGAVVELLGEPDQPREVALPRQLALSQPLRRRLGPAVLAGEPPNLVGDRARRRACEPLEQLARGVSGQERCALKGNLRVTERFLEV